MSFLNMVLKHLTLSRVGEWVQVDGLYVVLFLHCLFPEKPRVMGEDYH